MEAVPRLPMIYFELNTSPESVDFGSKLKQYIRDHYHENPETYMKEIYSLESLRAAAIRPQRDVDGCSTLKQYYCQLHFLQSRFPMSKDGKAAVNFTWNDLYSNSPTSLPDIRFEMVNILYNIGALHSQLGAADSRLTENGLKLACTHFQCAAWAFQHVKDSYPQMPGINVAPNVMQFKHQMCLAQAQECILEKSMADNRKAAINAKVAVQIVDYYNMAMNMITTLEEEGSTLYSIGTKHLKRWRRYVKFKSAYYACISLLYQGMQSEEQQKMGERVAYYQAASDRLQEAFNLSKDIENQEAVQEALTFTMDVVVGKMKPAQNENNLIYHEKVPDREALPDVKGKSLVRGIAFSVNDTEISGQDIFANLVPMKAHEASSLYSEEKAKLLRRVSGNIDKKEEQLVSFMSSLQLDYLHIFSQMDKIPQELIDSCAAMTGKTDAIQNLISSMNSLAEVSAEVEAMLSETFELIQAEEVAEKEYQEVMGSRPPSIVATDLTREANKYQEAHKKASESNETLHKAMTLHITNLKILMLPLNELTQQIPVLPALEPEEEKILNELQLLVNKVDEMKRQRSMLNNQLRESICNDDITNTLIIKQNEDHEKIFAEELKKHDKIIQLIDQNLAAQENILQALSEVYAQFAPTRKRINEVLRKRNTMVSALLSSYEAYEDLLAKSGKGLKFYKKLVTNISKLLQRCRGTCKVQEEEREQMLMKNGKLVPKPKPDNEPVSNNSGPKLKDYLNSKRNTTPPTTNSNPSLNTFYNPNLYQPGSTNPTSASPQPAPFVDPALSIPPVETKPQWVPSIRPTPLGSEGTNTPSKPPEMRSDYPASDSYQPYSNATPYSQYNPYPQNYSYDPSKYPYPQSEKPTIPTAYPNSAEPSNNYMNDLKNATYPPSVGTPASQSGENPAANTVPNFPSQPLSNTNYYQAPDAGKVASAQSQIPYQSFTPPASLNNPTQYPQPYTSAQTSLELSQTVQNYSFPEAAMQQASYPTYSTPTTLPTQTVTEPSLSYPSNTVYSNPNDVYIPNHYSGLYNQYETQTYPGYSAGSQNNTNYVTGYSSGTNQQTTDQSASYQYYNYNASAATSNAYPAQNTYYQPASESQPTQFEDPTKAYSQTAISSYPMAQPQQYMNMQYSVPFSTSEFLYMQQQQAFYTNAGQYQTLHTNSSQVAEPSTPTPPTGVYAQPSDPNYMNNYYNIPYGYQYQSPVQENVAPAAPSPAPAMPAPEQVQSPLAPQNSLTYMQAHTSNAGTTLTYSMNRSDAGSNLSDASSNVDLLAGLDFNVSQAPLIPTDSKNSLASEVKAEASDTPKVNVSQVSDQLAGLTLQKTGNSEEVKPSSFLSSQLPPLSVPAVDDKISPHRPASKDPFDDPEVLNQFTQEVEKFDKFIESLTAKTLNGPTPLDMKWKELCDFQEKNVAKQSISVARCYPMKNRFPDILPYDTTRVELPSTKDDYINASFIQNISSLCPPAILTQAPLPATYSDFWTMIWEQQVELIVCLQTDSELENQIYWPVEKGADLSFGRLKLTLQSCNNRNQWIERIIQISDQQKASRNIIHLQLTSWPGSSFPPSPGPFLSVVCECLSLYRQQRNLAHCVVIHCLSGVGRSGLFLLVLAAIAEINSGQGIPDLINLAGKMSLSRKNCLRDREHLKFAYQTILYYAQDLLMKRGILTTKSSFEEKRKSHTRHPSEDFLMNLPKGVKETEPAALTSSSDSSNQTVATPSSSTSNVAKEQESIRAVSSEENRRRNEEVFKNTGLITSSGQESDPLSQIDPLWSLKKASEN
ncbi:unnamed protein product [Bemisia tabaci]|uniref:Tyrosine-protein phosphatase non-receptor type 23 n=1 Tax=Bemisia tabaci TaxID=7038 RepID=A0A9P0F669_BEMTA|nr:unnamed protein product [Bemisia tabaci]